MTKSELIDDIHRTYSRVVDKVKNLTEEEFYLQKEGKWSIAENLAHLSLGSKLMTRALNAPKIALILKFGLHLKAFRGQNWIESTYHSSTIPDTTGFEPRMRPESTKEYELTEFINKNQSLLRSLEKWNKLTLDFVQLPHLVLGKLSVREYLMFIGFHIRHHEKAIDRILGKVPPLA